MQIKGKSCRANSEIQCNAWAHLYLRSSRGLIKDENSPFKRYLQSIGCHAVHIPGRWSTICESYRQYNKYSKLIDLIMRILKFILYTRRWSAAHYFDISQPDLGRGQWRSSSCHPGEATQGAGSAILGLREYGRCRCVSLCRSSGALLLLRDSPWGMQSGWEGEARHHSVVLRQSWTARSCGSRRRARTLIRRICHVGCRSGWGESFHESSDGRQWYRSRRRRSHGRWATIFKEPSRVIIWGGTHYSSLHHRRQVSGGVQRGLSDSHSKRHKVHAKPIPENGAQLTSSSSMTFCCVVLCLEYKS